MKYTNKSWPFRWFYDMLGWAMMWHMRSWVRLISSYMKLHLGQQIMAYINSNLGLAKEIFLCTKVLGQRNLQCFISQFVYFYGYSFFVEPMYEAIELRDGDNGTYLRNGVTRVVSNINEKILRLWSVWIQPFSPKLIKLWLNWTRMSVVHLFYMIYWT